MNPTVDASNRQVLFSNQLLPLEENLKRILVHYDEYGFGNGFDLSKPVKYGKFSGTVDMTKGYKTNSSAAKAHRSSSSSPEDKKESLHEKLVKINENSVLRSQATQPNKSRNLMTESKTYDKYSITCF